MKVAVTGALGHIGSRFIRELPSASPGVEIVLLDDMSSQRYCSLFDLPPEGRYRFEEVDVLTADLATILSGVDVVIHLAAITDAEGSVDIPDEVEQVNFGGTERVAKACIDCGCKLIFLSTTSVYGSQDEQVDEDCPVLRPQSPYAASKLRAEQRLHTLGERNSLRYVICRFGTIFGASIGMRFHTAINKFIWQACMGKPITVWSTALHQYRPYLDLADAVSALHFIMDRGIFDRRVYNVITTNATVQHIMDVITTFVPDISIESVNSPIMNQLSYKVSNSRFRDLGFEFTGDLTDGIGGVIGLLQASR